MLNPSIQSKRVLCKEGPPLKSLPPPPQFEGVEKLNQRACNKTNQYSCRKRSGI